MNNHLGGENLNVARALLAGKGFADPFGESTGPTAWTPPIFPALLAGILWLCGGNLGAVSSVMVLLQLCVLAGTGLLVAALARHTILWKAEVGGRKLDLTQAMAAVIFVIGMSADFFLWFQFTHDVWLVLLVLDLLLVGFCWGRPLDSAARAAGWGLLGGICALTNPIVAFAWGTLTLALAVGRRGWLQCVLACTVAGLTVAPWLTRNYLVFGCWIPIKSNAAYELFQSQCLTADGLVILRTFDSHPYTAPGVERQKYREMGETAYLQWKGDLFRQSVQADPWNFVQRLGQRFVAVTLWYVPFSTMEDDWIPGWVTARRWLYPLPFLACVLLVISSLWQRLLRVQWLVIGLYVLYLLPYIGISYYDRYGAPLVAVKMLILIWGIDRLAAACRFCWAAAAQMAAADESLIVDEELVTP